MSSRKYEWRGTILKIMYISITFSTIKSTLKRLFYEWNSSCKNASKMIQHINDWRTIYDALSDRYVKVIIGI